MGVVAVFSVAALFSFGLVFMFCEFGEQLRTRSDEINDAICELDWDSFPLPTRRMMPIIISITQHPAELVAYGGCLCARNTFKRVSIPTKVGKYKQCSFFNTRTENIIQNIIFRLELILLTLFSIRL